MLSPVARYTIVAWNTAYGQWLAGAKIVVPTMIIDGGLEAAVTGLDELLAGTYQGNVVARLTNHD